MKQLESDGLLKDEPMVQAGADEAVLPQPAAGPAPALDVAPGPGPGGQPANAARVVEPVAAAAGAAGVEVQEGLGEQEMAEAVGPEAEQKVLGYLTQEPQWSKVGVRAREAGLVARGRASLCAPAHAWLCVYLCACACLCVVIARCL